MQCPLSGSRLIPKRNANDNIVGVNSSTSASASSQWQSGYLSYATAELVAEFPTLEVPRVMEYVSQAIDQVPATRGVNSLLDQARALIRMSR